MEPCKRRISRVATPRHCSCPRAGLLPFDLDRENRDVVAQRLSVERPRCRRPDVGARRGQRVAGETLAQRAEESRQTEALLSAGTGTTLREAVGMEQDPVATRRGARCSSASRLRGAMPSGGAMVPCSAPIVPPESRIGAGWPALDHTSSSRSAAILQTHTVANASSLACSAESDLVERGDHRVGRDGAAQEQGAPGRAERDRQRCGFGAVAGDVADQEGEPAVGERETRRR